MKWVEGQFGRKTCTLGKGVLRMAVWHDGVTGKGYRASVGELILKGHFEGIEEAKKAAENLARNCFLVMMEELVE